MKGEGDSGATAAEVEAEEGPEEGKEDEMQRITSAARKMGTVLFFRAGRQENGDGPIFLIRLGKNEARKNRTVPIFFMLKPQVE